MSIAQFDIDMIRLVRLNITAPEGFGGGSSDIDFQFPPQIVSDNKGGQWREEAQRLSEPLAIFNGGKTRAIQLKWRYIVTGGNWSAGKISKIVKKLRAYYYNIAGSKLLIKFGAYNVVGPGGTTWTFRSDDISVSHGDTLIRSHDGVYPLITDISMNLKFLVSTGTTGSVTKDALIKIEGAFPLPTDIQWA